MSHATQHHCSQCGSNRIARIVPPDDDHVREVCEACGHIHYVNPKIVVGALPVWENKVLLCKRAIQPRMGFWTLPAGFMEVAETLEEGAARETREEAGADITLDALYTVISLPDIAQVYMLFRAQVIDGRFSAGRESLEVQLFDEADIPWDQLAFRTIGVTLKHFFADRKSGHFPVRHEVIRHVPQPASPATG